jgi:hypothetical protein
MDTRPRCQALRKDGTPCRAAALPGETLCWVHSPTTAEARREACQAGGRTRLHRRATLTGEVPNIVFHGTQDVLDLLADTASQCRRGELDCKVSNCLGYLASVALRALSEGETERRLEALEEQLGRLVPAGRNGHAAQGPRPAQPVG